jgi:hypothetical protein
VRSASQSISALEDLSGPRKRVDEDHVPASPATCARRGSGIEDGVESSAEIASPGRTGTPRWRFEEALTPISLLSIYRIFQEVDPEVS